MPEARNRFGDVVGCAFKGDGFYGIGGDGEEADDADDAKGENAEGDDDFDEAEGLAVYLHQFL